MKVWQKNRGIDFYYARLPDGNIDKSVFLKNLKEKYKSNAVAYVGDDYYDITLIETVDYSFVLQMLVRYKRYLKICTEDKVR